MSTPASDAEAPQSESIPLVDRPLISSGDLTVVHSDSSHASNPDSEFTITANAAEIRQRLFPPPGSESRVENGLRIGHFEVKERIGAGGMGAVFRATDLELSRDVALKVLNPQTAADPSLVSRFRKEARACAQLNHDNIARVFFTGCQDGVHYIVYEYVPGKTLRDLIHEDNRMAVSDCVNFGIQITLALSHLSACDIVHRDIKPSNIICTPTGRIKVVDLGLARHDNEDSIGELTVAGTTLGTFDYISPEQARDPRSADIRADVYSLGCTLFHMLSGTPPYPDGVPVQKLLDHTHQDVPDIRDTVPDIPSALAAIIHKMMMPNPDERYDDPGQLLSDLVSLAAHMGLRSVPAEGILWRRIAVRRKRELSGPILISSIVLLCTVLALSMHFLPGEQQRSQAEVDEMVKNVVGPFNPSPPNDSIAGGRLPPRPPSDSTPVVSINQGAAENMGVTETPGTDADATGATAETAGDVAAAPFVIRAADGGTLTCKTLRDAWNQANSGDEIVMNFNGPIETGCMTPRPEGQEIIVIRSGKGYSPILEFSGEKDRVRPGRLFALNSGLHLKLENVHLRINVQLPERDPSELGDNPGFAEWVAFDSPGATRVEVSNCTIDVRNPDNLSAAIFRLQDSTSASTDDKQTRLSVDRTIVRGVCDFVRIEGQQRSTIDAAQSAFVIGGTFVRNDGSSDRNVPETQRVNLDYCTCLAFSPLFVMKDSNVLDGTDPERFVAELDVHASSCVFGSLTSDGLLIQSQGNAFPEEQMDLLTWNGSYNRFSQISGYWSVESGVVSDFDQSPVITAFSRWEKRWERSLASSTEESELPVKVWSDPEWLSNLQLEDVSRFPIANLELNRSEFDFSGSGAASQKLDVDGNLPGVDISQLPTLP